LRPLRRHIARRAVPLDTPHHVTNRGKFRQVNWFVYALTALLVLRFVYPVRG
jgi:predicted permease